MLTGGFAASSPARTDAVTQRAGSGHLQLDTTGRRKAEKPPPHLPGEPQLLNAEKGMNIDERLSLHHEKGFHHGILPRSDPLALQGPHAPHTSAPEQRLPELFPEQGACASALAFPSGSEAAQNELAYALYYTRGKTLQQQTKDSHLS